MVAILNASTGRNNSTENKFTQFILSRRFDAGFSLRHAVGRGRARARRRRRPYRDRPLPRKPARREAMSAFGRPAAEPYEVFAVKYAHHERNASANFLGGDPHDGPMPLDFYVWLVRGNGRLVVVDLGFNAATAKARQRELIRNPVDGLRL